MYRLALHKIMVGSHGLAGWFWQDLFIDEKITQLWLLQAAHLNQSLPHSQANEWTERRCAYEILNVLPPDLL